MWNVENVPNEAGNLKRFPNTVSVPYGFFLMLYMKSERRPIKSKGNNKIKRRQKLMILKLPNLYR